MHTHGNSKMWVVLGIGVVIVVGIFLYTLFNTDEDSGEPTVDDPTIEDETGGEAEWVTYTNEEYGFTLEHPADWEVSASFDDPFAPKFNVHPADLSNSLLPLTHHSGATHVSIFPTGIPTEGYFGVSEPSIVTFMTPVTNPRDFVLEDGTRYATMASITSTHENWTESGFVFAHVQIEDGDVQCLRGGVQIGDGSCDPLTGDTLVRSGTVDRSVRNTEIRILESIEFIE